MAHPCISNLTLNNHLQNLINYINAEDQRRLAETPPNVVGGWAHWLATADHHATFVELFEELCLALNAPTVPSGHYALGNTNLPPSVVQAPVQPGHSSEMAAAATNVLAALQFDGEDSSPPAPTGTRNHPEYGFHGWLMSGTWDASAVEKADELLSLMRNALDR